jgi:hypothetical protein
MLFVLAPLLLGMGFYNYTFFRERAGRTSVVPAASPNKTTVQTSPTVVEGVAVVAEQHAATSEAPANRPPPRSYEEGIIRLSPRALKPAIAASRSPVERDIFARRSVDALADGAAAPIGGNHGAALAATDSGSAEQIPIPLRMEGWVRTPQDEYAIVNGELAKSGTRLPTDERVLTVTRGGVVVSTVQGIQVLPLFGEEPNKALQRTVRSVR